MSTRIERFKKRKLITEKNKSLPFVSGVVDQKDVDQILSSGVDIQKLESLDYSTDLNYSLNADPEEVEALLSELKGSFNKERMEQLLDEAKKGIISSIAGPLGLGKVVSAYDKVGGNVDTVHNVRISVYATNKEKRSYEKKGKYDSDKYHKDEKYKTINKEYSDAKKNGEGIIDYTTGEKIRLNDPHDLDHVVSAKEIHDDAGRILAGIDGVSLANTKTNLKPTDRTINRSKKADSMDDFLTRKNERIKDIKILKARRNLSEKEQNKLNKLTSLEKVDDKKAKEADRKARKEQNSTVNKEYYLSSKFLKNSLGTGAYEGAKMGFQQAFGILLVEFLSSSFIEIRSAFNQRLEGEMLYKDIKIRLKRIGQHLSSKWKDVIQGFSGGFISGFISNLITVIINMFVKTAKNVVRMIREGVFSLLKALKLILFPPENMSYQEATHEAMKLIAVGGIFIAGVALEEVAEKWILSIPFLAPFAGVISTVIVGALTAMAMALVTYLIDKMDILGVIKIEETTYVLRSIEGDIQETLKRCENVTEEVDGLLLPA